MGLGPADYLAQLQALVPQGAAWPRDPEAVLTKLLAALAGEAARIDARAEDLIEEADPRATLELLDDWERAFGLPDPCVVQPNTIQERRDALVARVTSLGGASIAYFTALAAAVGYAITIDEFRPFIAGVDRCGTPLGGDHRVRFNWRVNVGEARVTPFVCGASVCGDKLGELDRAEDLECVLARLSPAHTNLIFSYTGV